MTSSWLWRNKMASIFGVNPFSTPVGQRIGKDIAFLHSHRYFSYGSSCCTSCHICLAQILGVKLLTGCAMALSKFSQLWLHFREGNFLFSFPKERATDGNMPSEDWALNIEICDIINETEEGWVSLSKKVLVQCVAVAVGFVWLATSLCIFMSPRIAWNVHSIAFVCVLQLKINNW